MATDITICNSALAIIGADENAIATFSDSTREARICSQLYATTKGALLSRHPWSFSLGQATLARLSDTPLFEYEYAFQMPTNPKAIRIIKTENDAEDYRIFEDKLYTNYATMKILYQFDPGEEDMPEYFIRALEFRMAELLALALSQDETFSQVLEGKAFRAFKEARYTDSANTPPKSISDAALALTSVR